MIYVIVSVLFLVVLIGIPMLIAAILWYKYTYISLNEQGIHMHKGWLNVTDKQVPYEKVNSVESRQSLSDRMLGCGQISIFTGNDVQGIAFMGIDRPTYVKQAIQDRVSAASQQRTATSAMQPTSGADELAKYAELKEKGIITQAEFDQKKQQILG
jgi:uncharacterized membrane protein YdbT with pleckstrin-like domain